MYFWQSSQCSQHAYGLGHYFHFKKKQMNTKEGKKLAPDTQELTVQVYHEPGFLNSSRAEQTGEFHPGSIFM